MRNKNTTYLLKLSSFRFWLRFSLSLNNLFPALASVYRRNVLDTDRTFLRKPNLNEITDNLIATETMVKRSVK